MNDKCVKAQNILQSGITSYRQANTGCTKCSVGLNKNETDNRNNYFEAVCVITKNGNLLRKILKNPKL
jgi:hypothetical protein